MLINIQSTQEIIHDPKGVVCFMCYLQLVLIILKFWELKSSLFQKYTR